MVDLGSWITSIMNLMYLRPIAVGMETIRPEEERIYARLKLMPYENIIFVMHTRGMWLMDQESG